MPSEANVMPSWHGGQVLRRGRRPGAARGGLRARLPRPSPRARAPHAHEREFGRHEEAVEQDEQPGQQRLSSAVSSWSSHRDGTQPRSGDRDRANRPPRESDAVRVRELTTSGCGRRRSAATRYNGSGATAKSGECVVAVDHPRACHILVPRCGSSPSCLGDGDAVRARRRRRRHRGDPRVRLPRGGARPAEGHARRDRSRPRARGDRPRGSRADRARAVDLRARRGGAAAPPARPDRHPGAVRRLRRLLRGRAGGRRPARLTPGGGLARPAHARRDARRRAHARAGDRPQGRGRRSRAGRGAPDRSRQARGTGRRAGHASSRWSGSTPCSSPATGRRS